MTTSSIGKVGRFELERIVGKGGMGKVYLATDQESSETVAVKFIRSQLGKQEAFLKFFHRREAALARQIVHPNVIRILDHGITAGRQFISMEYARGRNLQQILESGRLGVDDVLELLRQTACGLQAAHAQGVVHGDIKPANILLLDNRGQEDGASSSLDSSDSTANILESPFETPANGDRESRYEDALFEEIERRSRKKNQQAIDAPPYFERGSEMRFMEHYIERIAEGRGAFLVVRGDPGTGKTRLVEEFWERHAADLRNVAFVAGSGKGLVQLAGTLFEDQPVSAKDLDECATVLLDRLSDDREPTILHLQNHEEMLELNGDFLMRWTRDLDERPLLLVVELSTSNRPTPTFRRLLGSLERWTHELSLRTLTEYQVRRFLHVLFGQAVENQSTGHLAGDLYRLGHGNFTAILELLRGYLDRRTLTLDSELRKYVYRHSAREYELEEGKGLWEKFRKCSKPEQQVLLNAAFIGNKFFFDILQRFSGIDETLLFYLMKSLVSEGFVTREDRVWYRFTNRAFCEFLADRRADKKRHQLHARVAKLLRTVPIKDSTDLFRVRAHHWKGCDNHVSAVEYFLEAAHYAASEYRTADLRETYHEILAVYRKTRNQSATQQAISSLLRDRFCTEGNWYEILGKLASGNRPVWIKITDFGISFRADDGMQHSMGTPRYMAPERVQKKKAGTASDIFALGVIAFELLVGETPFPHLKGRKVMEANEKLAIRLPADVARSLPGRLVALCEGMMTQNPDERWDTDRVIRDLEKIQMEREKDR